MSRRASAVEEGWGWSEFLSYFARELGPLSAYEAGYVDWLRAAPDFPTAVDRAVRSRKPDGKMHNHQSKIPLPILLDFGQKILDARASLPPGQSWPDFHALWLHLDRIKPWGIGPLAVYDIAERLGRFLRLEPTRVYLHAGPTLGAKALGIDVRGKEWLEMSELPEPMRVLKADEAEDFLCCFNAYLSRFNPASK